MSWTEHNFCEATHHAESAFPGQVWLRPRRSPPSSNGVHQIIAYIVGAQDHTCGDQLHASYVEEGSCRRHWCEEQV